VLLTGTQGESTALIVVAVLLSVVIIAGVIYIVVSKRMSAAEPGIFE